MTAEKGQRGRLFLPGSADSLTRNGQMCLYGSATANMLYDDPGWSRSLPGVFSGPLHDFLKRVLFWVLQSMPKVEWVACLGNEAWFLTCNAIGIPAASRRFKEYRDACRPALGTVGEKIVGAFPFHHPSRVSNAAGEKEWRAFAALIAASQNNATVDTHQSSSKAVTE